MLTTPSLAVLVVAHNQAVYLPETLASLRAQTLGMPALQFVFVDDASTDGTGGLFDAFAREVPHAVVRRVDFRNVGKARNAALSLATAPYLMFVDGDDLLALAACEQLLAVAQAQEAAMVISPLQRFYDEFKPHAAKAVPSAGPITPSALWEKLLKHQTYMGHVIGTLFARRLFENLRFPEITCYEDISVIPALLQQNPRIVCWEHAIYGYRQHGQSTSSRLSDDKAQAMLDMLGKLKEYVRTPRQAKLFDALCVRQCRVLMDNATNLSAGSRYRIRALIEAIPFWSFIGDAGVRVRHKRLLLQNRREVRRW